jgi:hypothetical protein
MESNKHEMEIKIALDCVGLFVGKGGCSLKDNIIIPTKKDYVKTLYKEEMTDEEKTLLWKGIKVNCHVTRGDKKVNVVLSYPQAECLEIMKKHLSTYVEKFNQQKITPGKKKISYTFKLQIDNGYIGKLIGVEGSRISELSDEIKSSLKLEKPPYIRFNDSGSEHVETLSFKGLETGEVWIFVSFYGEKSFKIIKSLIESFIKNTLCEDEDDLDTEEEQTPETTETFDGDW